jgi:hypothetical protein
VVEIVVHQFVPKTSTKKHLKSKRNCSQDNPLENNVEQVPAKASTLFSKRLFWRQLRFGGNWLIIIFQRNLAGTTTKYRHNQITVPAQIWRELAPHYFLADCFGGSSDMAETKPKQITTVLYTKYVRNTKKYFPKKPNKLT